MTVYIDLLLIENLIMNFAILSTTAFFAKKKVKWIRLFIGSLFASLYVFIAFFPEFRIYLTLLAKIFFSMAIIAITFWESSVKEFFKLLFLFYLSSFMFGGVAFGILYLLNSEFMIYNGVPYITNSGLLKTLLISVVVGYFIVKICWGFIITKINKDNIAVNIDIKFNGKDVKVKGILDTGNSLRDPISNLPVMVVEYDALKTLLPLELSKEFFDKSESEFDEVIQVIGKTNLISRFRLVPFTSLGTQRGMLLGFKPDKVQVIKGNEIKEFKDIIIGIYSKKLSVDDSYRALISVEMT